MKEKVKRWSVDLLKILTIAVVIGILCVTAPYFRGILGNRNHFVVTDGVSAEQSITNIDDKNVLVEFRCPSDDFPRLLAMFVRSHKSLNFRMVETIHSEDPSQVKGFLATFIVNQIVSFYLSVANFLAAFYLFFSGIDIFIIICIIILVSFQIP